MSVKVLRNTQSDYNQLSERTAVLRRQGVFPDLLDRTRGIIVPQFWTSPEDAQEWTYRAYRRDRTEGQEYAIYLAVEKAGLAEQLDVWFSQPLGIPILPLGGYHSQSFEREILTHADVQGRPSVVLYAGDLDASGEDIERNFREHLDFDVFVKVALTKKQAEQYKLPPLPGKTDDEGKWSDSRAGGFIEKYGENFQIEVDALDPDVLRRLFMDEISRFFDVPTFQRVMARERVENERLPHLISEGEES